MSQDSVELHFKDITTDGFYISLAKLTGKQVADVTGYLSTEFGDPMFQVCNIVMSDGSKICVEGEHDCPYLSPYYTQPQGALSDDAAMERLYDEYDANDDEDGQDA